MKCPECGKCVTSHWQLYKHLVAIHDIATLRARQMTIKAEAAETEIIPATEGKEEVNGS